MFDEEASKRGSKPKTLVDICHAAFQKGYQDGRVSALQEQVLVTDKDLVEFLQSVFDERNLDPPEEREENLYYAIGHGLGEVSIRVVPYHPYEACGECP